VRVEAGDDFFALALLRQREQRADSHDPDAASKRQALGHARGDAKPGKRARAFAIRDALDLPEVEARLREHVPTMPRTVSAWRWSAGSLREKSRLAAARSHEQQSVEVSIASRFTLEF